MRRLPPTGSYFLRHRRKTGSWISVASSTVNITELGDQEWRDEVFLRYLIEPPDLPRHCNICRVGFRIRHALDYNNDILVTSCHNKIRYGVANPVRNPFTPTHVRDNTLINPGHAVWIRKDFMAKSNPPNNSPRMMIYSE